MNDFRIVVFLSVAQNLSFTKASNELCISQPAISKHISEIENQYGIQLFERANNKVTLTNHGQTFLKFAQEIHRQYRDLEFEMNLLTQNYTGELSIGASTTIAQYLLPMIMSKFIGRFPEIKLSLATGNTEHIESLILDHKIDMGIVEGASHKKEFKYSLFAQDELVLVTSTKNKRREEVYLDELKTLPIVLRESGSGTLEVIQKLLKTRGIKLTDLNIIMQLGSTEAIKRFVLTGDSYAIISIAAVVDELRRGELTVVEIDEIRIEREFSFITINGSQNRLGDKFMQFALTTYNKML